MRIFLIALILLFSGCGSKITEIFQKDNKYITLSQYTQRAQLVKSLETIALINATYINHILKNNDTKKYEIFIIGVYNSNDYRGYEKGGIYNNHYLLTMNNKKFIKATKADIVKLNLTDYPFYNKWMKYYIVYFPKTDSKKLYIKYTNLDLNSSATLTIPKQIYK